MNSTLVHNLPPVATRLLQHLRCQPLRMSRNKTRTKRVARNPQSRAATAGRSKINPWKVLQRPRPPTAPHPSLPRASPVCTPRDPISHSSPSNCLQKSPSEDVLRERARRILLASPHVRERADKTISSRPLAAGTTVCPVASDDAISVKKGGREQYKRD